jgi:hypothetical protein
MDYDKNCLKEKERKKMIKEEKCWVGKKNTEDINRYIDIVISCNLMKLTF